MKRRAACATEHARRAILATVIVVSGCAHESVPADDARGAFFERIRSLCGTEWSGVTELAPDSDEIFRPHPLSLRIDECAERDVRFRFGVADDFSRNWLLRFDADGRLLYLQGRGDLLEGMKQGGSWGGWATGDGTGFTQSFPDYRGLPAERAGRGPRIWRLQLSDSTSRLVYFLDQGDEPRFRLVFNLDTTPEPDARPGP